MDVVMQKDRHWTLASHKIPKSKMFPFSVLIHYVMINLNLLSSRNTTVDNQTMDTEAILSTIEAILRQEKTGYTVPDYLRHLPEYTAFGQPIDADARYLIAKWCFKIMDICDSKHETAVIAISCLDRFVSTPSGQEILLDRGQ